MSIIAMISILFIRTQRCNKKIHIIFMSFILEDKLQLKLSFILLLSLENKHKMETLASIRTQLRGRWDIEPVALPTSARLAGLHSRAPSKPTVLNDFLHGG